METIGQSPHVAILQSPGMGHLIPLAEFAKRLVLSHGFTATLITFSNFSSPAETTNLSSLPPGISRLSLPVVPLGDLPADARIETVLSVLVARSVPAVAAVLRSLKQTTRLAAFVVDIFGGDTLSTAKELRLPHYIFSPCNLLDLSLTLHLPTLHKATSGEYRDLADPVRLRGCVPLLGADLFDPLQDRSNEAYSWLLNMAERFREADGILVNTFEALEPAAAEELRKPEPGRPPVNPVGPLTRASETGDSECLRWLDRQLDGSVVFVSFGSGGTLSGEQTREVALGLERSGQRFLWVVRCPIDEDKSGAFFGRGSAGDPFAFLPEGFVERTKERGFLVKDWAPQVRILSHRATGGFLSHCGWNSTLESVVNGVPMVAWPLYAEQRMNAVMLAEGVRIALRPKEGEDGVIRADEIARVVRELMEGEEGKAARDKVKELKVEAAKALGEEGSSHKALAEVATKWKDGLRVNV